MKDPLISQVERTLQKYEMFLPGERILVACSGGPDSVALLYLLKELASPLKIRLNLLHFDHALRKGSALDAQFVRKLAAKFEIPFYGERRKTKDSALKGLSPEEAARKSRFDFFSQTSKKTRIGKIALGHQGNDQAETVLMRVIQGTGVRGLQAIRPVTKMKGVNFVRPLIEVSRDQVRDFLKNHSIFFRMDPTNQSKRFLRNRIRMELLPLIEKKFNPRAREALCRLAETSSREVGSLDDWVKNRWKSWLRSRRNGTVQLERDLVVSLPAALQFRIFDELLRSLDPKSGLDFQAWKRIEKGIGRGRFRITLPRNLDLNLTKKSLCLRQMR